MIEQPAETNEPGSNSPEKPVEEKSSTGGISIQEEYVHELHLQQGFAAAENPLKYSLIDEAKLSIVHFELVSPPPDL